MTKILRGYQLSFQKFNSTRSTCIQIYPLRRVNIQQNNDEMNEVDEDNDLISDEKNLILNIKDPSFISQLDMNFAFNFGTVSLEILLECKNSAVCIHDELKKPHATVGVESQNKIVDASLYQLPQNCKQLIYL